MGSLSIVTLSRCQASDDVLAPIHAEMERRWGAALVHRQSSCPRGYCTCAGCAHQGKAIGRLVLRLLWICCMLGLAILPLCVFAFIMVFRSFFHHTPLMSWL